MRALTEEMRNELREKGLEREKRIDMFCRRMTVYCSIAAIVVSIISIALSVMR